VVYEIDNQPQEALCCVCVDGTETTQQVIWLVAMLTKQTSRFEPR
jgi:hypothetical protein